MATSSSPAEAGGAAVLPVPGPADGGLPDGGRRLLVGVLGSARLGPDDPRHRQAEAVGGALARAGWAVMTGGYGGLMAAVASGAAAAGGHVVGLPMRGWAALTPGPAGELRWCDSYPERLGHLLACDAVVALDGGVGTLAELTVVWSAAQTEPAAPAVVVMGPAWRAMLELIAGRMVVGPADLALVTAVEGPDEVVAAVRAGLAAARVAAPRG